MIRKILFSLIALLCITSWLKAAPTTAKQAEKVVKGWLKINEGRPLKTLLGQQIKKLDIFYESNSPAYYIIYLNPSGFVIVPADDLLEPIIGFVPHGTYDPSHNNPLGALVDQDLRGRVSMAWDAQSKNVSGTNMKAITVRKVERQAKWNKLQGIAEQQPDVGIMGTV
jgi:hypothetical protein